MPRGKWTPGPRQPAREKLEERYAWVDNSDGEFVIFVQDPKKLFHEDGAAKTTYLAFGSGENVHLTVNPKKSRHSVTIMLTNLTERELDELKQLVDLAFEWARPVVQLRDRDARERLAAGDDIDPRNYRQVPQFTVRRRPGREHGEELRVGSADVPGVGGNGAEDQVRGSDASDRDAGLEVSGMADDPEESSFATHDASAYYESPEPGALGAGGAGTGELQVPYTTAVSTPPNPEPPPLPPPPPRIS